MSNFVSRWGSKIIRQTPSLQKIQGFKKPVLVLSLLVGPGLEAGYVIGGYIIQTPKGQLKRIRLQ